jgi:hypothetical protein
LAISSTTTDPPEHLAVLWRLELPGSTVSAELWTHPHGWELRTLWDGQLLWSRVHPSLRAANDDAGAAWERLARSADIAAANVDAKLTPLPRHRLGSAPESRFGFDV